MPHSELIKFTFSYDNRCKTPLIPIRFIDSNGRPTPTFNAILDSGADEATIPKRLADKLGFKNLIKREKPIHTAGGKKEAFTTKANFNLGRGGREVKYTDIDICVIDIDMPILIGITPVFEDYQVTIKAYNNKFVLDLK